VVTYNNQTYTGLTNKDGSFTIIVTPAELVIPDESEWITVQVTLVATGEILPAEVLVEGRGNTYGIISDIDDTILVSNVSKTSRLLYTTITKNAFRRTIFAGTADLYNALVKGSDGESSNPIMYISSSHWNLYFFLKELFMKNNVPKGPLVLQNYISLFTTVKNRNNHAHKKSAIETMLATYPTLPFILVGDDGEHDVAIYTAVATQFPGRITAILIRKGNYSDKNNIEHIVPGIKIYSAHTSKELLLYAKQEGLII